MKKVIAALLFLAACAPSAWSQTQTKIVRQPALGVSFFFNDYETARRIRSTSLNQVLRDKRWSDLKDMAPGLAVTYFKGLHPNVDFAGTAAFSFPRIVVDNKPAPTNSAFLAEVDASVNLKMLPDDFVFTPYLIAGVGGSKYGSSYGAFIPVGGGLKLNLFNEAAIFITQQYRIPVINGTNNYHFMTTIGIAGNLGKN